MNLSYLYLKKILEEELRDHDCQCLLNPDFTVTISCRVDGPTARSTSCPTATS